MLLGALTIAPLLPPTPVRAAELSEETLQRIDTLLAEAREHFDNERFAEAAELLVAAFTLDPNPRLAFNVGRAFERAGDYGPALDYYRQAAAAPDDDELVVRATEAVARVEVLFAATTPAPRPDQPDSGATTLQTAAHVRPPLNARQRQRLRVSGYSLLGTGAVLSGVGALFAVQSTNRHDEAVALGRTGIERQRFDDTVAAGQRSQLLSTLSYGVGFTALASGAGLLITERLLRPDPERPTAVAWQLGTTGPCPTLFCLGAGVEF